MNIALRRKQKGARVAPWLTVLGTLCAYGYFGLLFGWFITYLSFGDRWWWLFILNTFAIYLWLPVPLVVACAVLLQRVDLWLGTGIAVALGIYLYGSLFVPRAAPARAEDLTITVLSLNTLGWQSSAAATIAALRNSGADLIALQELNPTVAEAIAQDLHTLYPYQLLEPSPNDTGMGLISRYPLHATDHTLSGKWIGTPQIVTIDLHGTPITIINLHNISFPVGDSGWPATIEWTSRERERQAHQIVDFATLHPGPLIIMGDFNTAELSTAYRVLTSKLHDSWREAGYGLGHTFPGGNTAQRKPPSFYGVPVPMWLVRIDYIFHSDKVRTLSARLGPWDGRSDHRPVMAELRVSP